jgi:hypothetical protein
MEEFFDILKTQNSLPSGTIPLPDIPPSLAAGFAAAATTSSPHSAPGSHTTAAAAGSSHDAAALQERLMSHARASSSNRHSSNGTSSGSMQLDQHDLVEAALLLEEQQHPQHVQQSSHNLGSSSLDVGMPDRSVAISGLGLEVELEDVRFGYQPERQVRCAVLASGLCFRISCHSVHCPRVGTV